MNSNELQRQLLSWTIRNSGAENRTHLGMSTIGWCPLRLYKLMLQGRQWRREDYIYCHLGYLFERDILSRLAGIDPGRLGPSREFTDFGGRFRGHTDGEWDGDLLEIKSTTAHKLPNNGWLPRDYYWQVQTYMSYGDYRQCQVIYIARDTGDFCVFPVRRDKRIGELARFKAALVLEAVDLRQPPECECGRCTGNGQNSGQNIGQNLKPETSTAANTGSGVKAKYQTK